MGNSLLRRARLPFRHTAKCERFLSSSSSHELYLLSHDFDQVLPNRELNPAKIGLTSDLGYLRDILKYPYPDSNRDASRQRIFTGTQALNLLCTLRSAQCLPFHHRGMYLFCASGEVTLDRHRQVSTPHGVGACSPRESNSHYRGS